MDLLVLRRLITELDETLRGRRIEQVWALPKHDVVLAVGRRSEPRLWFSAEPADPHLYLRPGSHPSPQRPPGFAMAARGILVGRRIAALRLVRSDRIVELTCAGQDGPRIVFELIPRRATMLVVDHEDVVRAVWKPRRGRPALGERYRPPSADRRQPLEEIDVAGWDDLQGLPDRDERVRGLLRTIAGMSPLVAREIAHRNEEGTPLPQAAREEIERGAAATHDPRIYAPQPLDELSSLPGPDRFLVAPYAMRHLDGTVVSSVEPYPTLIAAAAAFYPLRSCIEGLQAARESLTAALEVGVARAQRARDAVSEDVDSIGDPDEHRRHADLLLAYPSAPVHGSVVRVPDPYAGGDGQLDIEVDPSMSRVENAQAYYQRARRAERSAERTRARRESLRLRQDELSRLLGDARAARELSTLRRIARRARTRGVDVAVDRWMQPECSVPAAVDEDHRRPASTPATAPRPRTPAGVDAFLSSDGFEILVGRSAQGNEKVTHKLAAPHDFWLHAEGPGSHVLIRNPTRAARPSDDSLREAASLAAYYSRSRGATKVNVRWTQARHVHKPRGAPTGQVALRQSKTFLAEPLAPERLFADDDGDN